jgi:hypothetical protein
MWLQFILAMAGMLGTIAYFESGTPKTDCSIHVKDEECQDITEEVREKETVVFSCNNPKHPEFRCR